MAQRAARWDCTLCTHLLTSLAGQPPPLLLPLAAGTSRWCPQYAGLWVKVPVMWDPTSGCPSSWSRGLIYKSLQLQKKENKERQSEREKKREERNHVYCELFNGKQYPTLIWGWFCFQFISENTEAQRGQVRYSRSQNQEVAEPRFKDRFLFQVQHSLWFIKPFFCFWSYPPYYKYKPRYYTMCPMDILSFFTVTQQGRFLRLLAWRFTSLLIEMRLIKVTVPKIT